MTSESETEPAFNPYQSPNSPQQSATVPVAQPAVQPGLPVFCTVMFIISIICSLFKSVIILPGMTAFSDIIKAYDYHVLAYMDLIVQVVLIAIGIIGNVILLMKHRNAAIIGFTVSGFVIVACLTATWSTFNGPAMRQIAAEGPPEVLIVSYVSFAVVMAIRLALLALYTWAVILYDRWDRQRSMATLEPQSLPNDFQNSLGE